MVKDRFITGLRKGKILDRLLEEQESKSLSAILEIDRNKEAALLLNNNVSNIHKMQVDKYRQKSRKSTENKSSKSVDNKNIPSSDKKFGRCRDTNHENVQCKYKTYKYKVCSKVGYFAKVSRNSKATSARVNKIEQHNSEDLFNIDSQSKEDSKITIGEQSDINPDKH